MTDRNSTAGGLRRAVSAQTFNADEIFEMAQQIERNGARFYHSAANIVTDPRVSSLLVSLARMEEEHERIFAWMRSELGSEMSRAGDTPPRPETIRYLQAFADGLLFDPNADPAGDIAADATQQDILLRAIAIEKDSIAIYVGLKEVVPAALGKNRIDEIIHEEMSHASVLSEHLAASHVRTED